MADMEGIPEFFKGRSIFITGATGFMGKVLMEKLLRSCPDVATIYILVRPKKGNDPQTRINIISESCLFDQLKQKQPDALKKIKAIEGDVSKLGLALSNTDRQTLEDNVSIVFNMAASVRFNTPLRDAIFMNTRSAREIVELARNMKQLKVLLHVSTTFCHPAEKEMFEKVYPPPADWRQIIELAETTDDLTLRILTDKFLNIHPNTYTFTKALAEQIIEDCHSELPAIIVRPSIVIPINAEPIPGWTDSFIGLAGLMVAVGKGISHVTYYDENLKMDFIPVDIVIKIVIFVAVQHAQRRPQNQHEVSIYHASADDRKLVTMAELTAISIKLSRDTPFNNILYYPTNFATTSKVLFYLLFVLWHILPAILVDMVMYIMGNKFRLLKIQRQIFTANLALGFFALNDWHFHNNNTISIEKYMKKEDEEGFSYGKLDIDRIDFMNTLIVGARIYLVKESLSTLPAARRHLKRMTIIHYILCTATVALAGRVLYGFMSVFYVYLVGQP